MRRTYFVLIISILSLLVGAYVYLQMYTKISHLSEEDLMWMCAYRVGDQIYFENEGKSEIDTLWIDKVYINNEEKIFNDIPFSFRSQYQADAGYWFNISHKNKIDDTNYFSISKNYVDMPCFYDWSILDMNSYNDSLFYSNNDYVGLCSGIRAEMVKVNIKGKEFDDCIIGDCHNSCEYNANKPMLIKKFIWSREFGLLQYETDDDVYTRTNINEL